MYLLKVASFDVSVLDLPEVDKAVQVTLVGLGWGGRNTTLAGGRDINTHTHQTNVQ